MSDDSQQPPASFGTAPKGRLSAKDRKRSIILVVVGLVIAGFIFLVILPEVIDYEVVWETIKALSLAQLLILIAAGLIYYIPEGWLYAAVMPGMSLWQGIKAWVASTGVGTTVPAVDLVARFGMYRSWGHSIDASMRGIFLSGAFDWVVKFSLPVIAVIVLAIGGVEGLEFLTLIAVIAGALLVLCVGVLVGLVRSERFTHWVAARVQKLADWALAKLRRNSMVGLSDRVVFFRNDSVDIARTRGVWAFVASILGKLWQYVMLVMALRMVGLDDSILSLLEIFVVWAIVLLITMIPITPGGIGIAELFYIGLFTQIAGEEYSSIIGAGVMLYRLIQWAMPIPIGWAVFLRWKRKVDRGDLPDPFSLSTSG
ncbi:MAG: lysylphosphatidylglycerol synthase transmembrane domain-containing protein [Acidimicrobiia bacterium]